MATMGEFTEAESELDAYFTDATGIGAQPYDAGGGAVWDDARIQRAHLALRHHAHRSAVRARARTEAVLWELDAEARATLALGFAPFGAARVTWVTWNAFRRPRGHLLALAIDSRALRVAYGRATGHADASAAQLLAFLDRRVQERTNVQPIADEAERRRRAAVNAYDVGRVRRNERERDERDAYVAQVRATVLR